MRTDSPIMRTQRPFFSGLFFFSKKNGQNLKFWPIKRNLTLFRGGKAVFGRISLCIGLNWALNGQFVGGPRTRLFFWGAPGGPRLPFFFFCAGAGLVMRTAAGLMRRDLALVAPFMPP